MHELFTESGERILVPHCDELLLIFPTSLKRDRGEEGRAENEMMEMECGKYENCIRGGVTGKMNRTRQ